MSTLSHAEQFGSVECPCGYSERIRQADGEIVTAVNAHAGHGRIKVTRSDRKVAYIELPDPGTNPAPCKCGRTGCGGGTFFVES
jgi:hypothetical protein